MDLTWATIWFCHTDWSVKLKSSLLWAVWSSLDSALLAIVVEVSNSRLSLFSWDFARVSVWLLIQIKTFTLKRSLLLTSYPSPSRWANHARTKPSIQNPDIYTVENIWYACTAPLSPRFFAIAEIRHTHTHNNMPLELHPLRHNNKWLDVLVNKETRNDAIGWQCAQTRRRHPTALLNFTVGSSGRMAQSPVAYTCDGCVNVAMLWNVTIHSLFVYFFSGTTPCLQIYFSKPYIQLSPKSVRFLKEIPHKHTQQTLTLYRCFIHVVVWLQCHRRGSYIRMTRGVEKYVLYI